MALTALAAAALVGLTMLRPVPLAYAQPRPHTRHERRGLADGGAPTTRGPRVDRTPPPEAPPSEESVIALARAKLAEDVVAQRTTRDERRRARLEEYREKYHAVVGTQPFVSEMQAHEERLARLQRLRAVASSELRSDAKKRIARLMTREQTRHLLVIQMLVASGTGGP